MTCVYMCVNWKKGELVCRCGCVCEREREREREREIEERQRRGRDGRSCMYMYSVGAV